MVHFVGAGPGDPELLTLKGKRLLEEADVIIYAGSLVNPQLLAYGKPEAEIYNSASMTLDEVVEVMERAEREEKTTVRLHTGDPSVYGAHREQMDALDRLGISYDVTPGEVAAELAPSYGWDTPAAVVCRASWEDEKIVRGTLKDIAGKVEQAGITRTALIAVGGFLGDDYELSKLYDSAFTHGFRKGTD